MKITNTQKQFITKHINGLRETMRLMHFTVQVHFVDMSDCTMQIEIDYRYLDSLIMIDRKKFCLMWKRDKMEVISYLAHELSHLITQEMSDPFASKGTKEVVMTKTQQHYEERVTEHLSRIAFRLYILEKGIK